GLSNTFTVAFENSFGTDRLTLGIIITLGFGIIPFGGIKRIAKLSEYILVFLAVLYIGVAVFVMLMNSTKLPDVIS
ncbi:alanine:cation symporter family protein, partial [Bacillus sp. GbtcB13]|uniref:alanine:cation symporter family protein n=1 Tax=Bacillus sp. GbtcB13 TaxID=2824758 RepID=UPI001C2FAB61